jgi:hypothetical protein
MCVVGARDGNRRRGCGGLVGAQSRGAAGRSGRAGQREGENDADNGDARDGC